MAVQSFTHETLSGSTNGLGVKVNSTTVGVTLHSAISGSTSRDEIWLYAQNNNGSGVVRTLTIQFGGTTDPDNLIVCSIAAKAGPVLIVPGFPLRNALDVKAIADVANEVIIYGYVNRVTVT